MAYSQLVRSGFFGLAVLVAPLASAFAVPSDKEAWRSDEHGIIVYRDAVENDTYWFIPKIRFEARESKTVLRQKVLANGKTEYTVRIIPYFSKDLKELAAQNIPNIRQDSQLKPVIAKTIGITLPDFGYTFASASVTNFQYLESPRLIKFSLDAEEAATFNELYQDEMGVNVDFSIAYDGMMTDKFYNIEVSCKAMTQTLETGFTPSVSASGNLKGIKVFAGSDLELAFVRTLENSTKGVNIVSKGDLPGMQEMLRRVMNLCFESVGGYYDTYGDSTYPTRRKGEPTTDDTEARYPRRSSRDVLDETPATGAQFFSAGMSNAYMTEAELAAAEVEAIHDALDLDKAISDEDQEPGEGVGLLPSAELKLKFKYKKTTNQSDNQAVAKQISMKDSTSVIVIPGYLSANSKGVEKVLVKSLGEKKFSVGVNNTAASPLMTGVVVKAGEQWTLNAAFVFKARTSYSPWKAKQYDWNSAWPKSDGDLYFRIGNGHWTPVNGRSIIESGVIGGGELQFYLDRSSIFNRIPEKLRTGGILHAPVFTMDGINPEFSVQISGRRIDVK